MIRRARLSTACLALSAAVAGCAPPTSLYSVVDARSHLDVLAHTIGARPLGTQANARAREYLVERLRSYGFDVEVQEAVGTRHDLGRAARVANIVATRRGRGDQAVALVAHYDSVASGPGAADDAFGAAVVIEAARTLAERRDRRHSLIVLLTDGEESRLLGSAQAATTDEFRSRVRAFINVDVIGSGPPLLLFETGPGNPWLIRSWARGALRPRGASFALEIYRVLPRDTDFSMLKQAGAPGLNLALVGDGYAYHTDRDVAARIPDRALADAGATLIGIVDELDGMDLNRRAPEPATYFDIGGLFSISYGVAARRTLTIAALALGIVAWLRTSRRLFAHGLVAPVIAGTGAVVGAAVAMGSMIAATWLLRMSREVYHPWYAHPDRFFILLMASGALGAWLVALLWRQLPWRAIRQPAAVWFCTLPAWIVLAFLVDWFAPTASFLWTVPLLVVSVGLSLTPIDRARAIRTISLVTLAVASLLWVRDTALLARFAVTTMGMEPVITPVWLYAALLGVAGLMIVPSALGAIGRAPRPVLTAMTAGLTLTTIIAGLATYAAPAYTPDRPLRRSLRYVQDNAARAAFWEVGANEPGINLGGEAATFSWRPVRMAGEDDQPGTTATEERDPERRLDYPFLFRAPADLVQAPATVASTVKMQGADAELEVTVTSAQPGLSLTLMLPSISPLRSNFPPAPREPWQATYIASSDQHVTFRVGLHAVDLPRLDRARVVVGGAPVPGALPGGRLPPWAPADRTAWTATAVFALPLGLAEP